MTQLKNIFATKWGIISVRAFIGIFAPLLQKWVYVLPVWKGILQVHLVFTEQ